MSKREAITRLRMCLADLFDTRHRGTAAERYSKSQGFVDGYMQALADMKVVDDRELLLLVGEERRRAGERAETAIAPMSPRPSVPNFA